MNASEVKCLKRALTNDPTDDHSDEDEIPSKCPKLAYTSYPNEDVQAGTSSSSQQKCNGNDTYRSPRSAKIRTATQLSDAALEEETRREQVAELVTPRRDTQTTAKSITTTKLGQANNAANRPAITKADFISAWLNNLPNQQEQQEGPPYEASSYETLAMLDAITDQELQELRMLRDIFSPVQKSAVEHATVERTQADR